MKHLILASLTALALAAGISSPALAQSANETRGTGGQPEAAGQPENVGQALCAAPSALHRVLARATRGSLGRSHLA